MVLSFPVNICVATKAETPNATAHMMPKHRATPMAFVQPPAAIIGARVLFAGALKKRLNSRQDCANCIQFQAKKFNSILGVY